MPEASAISTDIAGHDTHRIWIRGMDLTSDVLGKLTFAEMIFLLIGGRIPDVQERRLVDAILVSLVEHGLTPSVLAARLTYSGAPESLQGAVAAGLLGVGSRVLGSMEECGRLLTRIADDVSSGTPRTDAVGAVVDEYRRDHKRLPGIGHAIHTDGDPRAPRLFTIARECGKHGAFLETLQELAAVAEARTGRRLPINVTGAVSAILLELGVPWQLHRGFALISRSAGLVAHVGEEMTRPITPALRKLVSDGTANGTSHPAEPRD
jgi:citrate synthase